VDDCSQDNWWIFRMAKKNMTMLFVADLHYALKQFDWLVAAATNLDPRCIIRGCR
jgi:hypothetical protein